VAFTLLVFWICIDVGARKYLDSKEKWSYNAQPLPALLDMYCRHIINAQYLYAMLSPEGLRLLTPTVEILCAPIAFLGLYLGNASVVNLAIFLICQMPFGISLTIRNAILLSYMACAVWCVFLPIGWDEAYKGRAAKPSTLRTMLPLFVTFVLVASMVDGNIWFETIGTDCSTGSMRQVWSTLLQN
jgi:hypothetical protein